MHMPGPPDLGRLFNLSEEKRCKEGGLQTSRVHLPGRDVVLGIVSLLARGNAVGGGGAQRQSLDTTSIVLQCVTSLSRS